MNTYLFTVPLAPGKNEVWQNFMHEINGSRNGDYKNSRKRAGINVEEVFLQQTPNGDSCVVMWETDNPQRSFEKLLASTDPFDKWFKDKVLIEAHGMDLSQPMPLNQRFVTYSGTPVKTPAGFGKNG